MAAPSRFGTEPTSYEANLFAAAQDLARRRGDLRHGRLAAAKQSHRSGGAYVLSDAGGRIISRLPLQHVRLELRKRYGVLRYLMQRLTNRGFRPVNLIEARRDLCTQHGEVRALAWAVAAGRRLPEGRPLRRLDLLISLLLVLLGLIPGVALLSLIPGLVFLAVVLRRNITFRHNLDQLHRRWLAAIRPEPDDACLERIYRLQGSAGQALNQASSDPSEQDRFHQKRSDLI